jgi:hypothetical protein
VLHERRAGRVAWIAAVREQVRFALLMDGKWIRMATDLI